MKLREEDVIGLRSFRLEVMGISGKNRHGQTEVMVRCDCGTQKTIALMQVRKKRNPVLSCGCWKVEVQREKGRLLYRRHGHSLREDGSRSPTYHSWLSMNARCNRPTAPDYHRYGGRGIRICARWQSFENFLADMGERPTGRTLDRIDVNGNYEPGNCRWATPSEQRRNQRVRPGATAS